MIFRCDCTESLVVDCGEFGTRSLWYNPTNSTAIAEELRQNWERAWPKIKGELIKMLEYNVANESIEWGDLTWLKDEWEIHVFDGFTDESPMPEGRIIVSVCMIRNGDITFPNYEVFLDNYDVGHSQPTF